MIINPWISDDELPTYDYFGSSSELSDIGEQIWTREQLEARGLAVSNDQLAAIVFGGIPVDLAAEWLNGEIEFFAAQRIAIDRMNEDTGRMWNEQRTELERVERLVSGKEILVRTVPYSEFAHRMGID